MPLFVDDAVLLDKEEFKLERLVDEFGTLYERQNLKVNGVKSNVMMFKGEGHKHRLCCETECLGN